MRIRSGRRYENHKVTELFTKKLTIGKRLIEIVHIESEESTLEDPLDSPV